MTRLHAVWALMLAVACGGGDPPASSDIAVLGAPPDEAIDMPPLPSASSGHLRVHAVGRGSMERDWEARAVWCGMVPALQILGDDSTSGSIIMLRPVGDDWSGMYPVAHPDSATRFPVAHVGVLLTPFRRGFTFQGVDGTVEIQSDGRRASGEFQMDLQESGSIMVMKYAGTFDRLRVERGDEAECRALGLIVDSVGTEPAPGG